MCNSSVRCWSMKHRILQCLVGYYSLERHVVRLSMFSWNELWHIYVCKVAIEPQTYIGGQKNESWKQMISSMGIFSKYLYEWVHLVRLSSAIYVCRSAYMICPTVAKLGSDEMTDRRSAESWPTGMLINW